MSQEARFLQGLMFVFCAEGLYTEMDFRNEGLNMLKMQQVLDESEFFDSSQIVIPKPFMDISSRYALSAQPVAVKQPEALTEKAAGRPVSYFCLHAHVLLALPDHKAGSECA